MCLEGDYCDGVVVTGLPAMPKRREGRWPVPDVRYCQTRISYGSRLKAAFDAATRKPARPAGSLLRRRPHRRWVGFTLPGKILPGLCDWRSALMKMKSSGGAAHIRATAECGMRNAEPEIVLILNSKSVPDPDNGKKSVE